MASRNAFSRSGALPSAIEPASTATLALAPPESFSAFTIASPISSPNLVSSYPTWVR